MVVDDYMLDKILDTIKTIISIEKSYDTKILINTDDKLPDNFASKIAAMLMTCVIKDDDKLIKRWQNKYVYEISIFKWHCGLMDKTNHWQHLKLLKTCVQSQWHNVLLGNGKKNVP